MHLYILPRGIKHDYDRFLNELACTYLPFRFTDKDGNIQPCMVQVSVRPIPPFYEVVFPEECIDIVLNTLLQGQVYGDGFKPFKKYAWIFRKMFKLKSIPEYKKDKQFPLYHANVECSGIGIKYDYWVNPKTQEKIINPTEEQKKVCFEGL